MARRMVTRPEPERLPDTAATRAGIARAERLEHLRSMMRVAWPSSSDYQAAVKSAIWLGGMEAGVRGYTPDLDERGAEEFQRAFLLALHDRPYVIEEG